MSDYVTSDLGRSGELAAIFDSAPEAMFLLEGPRLLLGNQAAYRVTGWSVSDLPDHEFLDILQDPTPELSALFAQDAGAAPDRELLTDHESRLKQRDGGTVRVSVGVRRYHVAESPRMLATVRVLDELPLVLGSSEREESARKIRVSDAWFRSVFDTAPNAFAIKNELGQNILVNPQMQEFLRRGEPDLLGARHWDFLNDEGYSQAAAREYASFVAGNVDHISFDVAYVRPDGEIVRGRGVNTAVRDDEGRFLYAVEAIDDITAQVETENSLRQSEARFRSVFNSSPVALSMKDRDNRIIMVNPEMEILLGRDAAHLLGRTNLEFLPKDWVREGAGRYARLLSGDEDHSTFERPFVRGDGSVRWTVGSNTAVRDAHGEFVYAVEAIQDVTERAENERKLRESEERFRTLFESVPIGIALKGTDGRNVMVNPHMQKLFGRNESELLGVPLAEFLPDDYERERADRWGQMSQGAIETSAYQKPYARKDGSVFWARARITALQDGNGGYSGAVQIIQDITEEIEGARKLQESEQRLRTLFDSAPVAMALRDPRGRYAMVNPQMQTLLGRDERELLGHDLKEFLPADHRPGAGRWNQMVAGEMGSKAFEKAYVRKDGSLVWVHGLDTGIRDESGAYLGGVQALQDVTERVAYERNLRESEERFRSLFEAAPIGIAVLDREGALTDANAAFCETLERSLDELVGQDTTTFAVNRVHEGSTSRVIAGDPKTVRRTRQLRTGTGRLRWIQSTTTAINDADGNFQYVLRMTEDVTEKRETEDGLRESEERFRSLFEGAPIGIQVVAPDRSDRRVNHALADMLGRSVEEVASTALSTWFDPAEEQVPLNTGDVLASEAGLESGVLTYQRVFADPEGNSVWAQVTATAVRNDDGSLKQIIRMVEDVTGRKRAEDALSSSERRFRSLFDQSPMGIAIMDADRTILDLNNNLERMLGRDASELLGQSFVQFASNVVVTGVFEQIVAGEVEFDKQERHLFPRPGAAEWVQYTTTSVRDDEGNFLYALRMVEDITERKRVEERLAASEERFKMLFEAVPVGITLLDTDGVIQEANSAMSEILDRNLPEVIGNRLRDWLATGDAPLGMTIDRMTADGLDRAEGEAEYVKGDGRVITGRQKTHAIRGEDGDIRYFIRTVEDVTERLDAERQVKESEEFLKALIEHLPQGLVVLDENANYLLINPKGAEMLGYTPEEFLGLRLEDVIRAGDPLIEVIRSMVPYNAATPPTTYEYQALRKDGTTFPATGSSMTFGGPGAGRRLALFRDLTPERDAERQLRDNQEFFRALVDELPEGISVLNEKAEYLVVNRTGAAITGYSPEELVGMHPWDLIPDKRVTDEIRSLIPFDDTKPTTYFETEVIRKDGSTVTVGTTSIHTTLIGGGRRISVWRDLTQQRETQRRIGEQIRAVAEADERERLARDLHDTVVQDLTGIAMRLELAKKMAEAGRQGLAKHLEDTDDFARTALRTARQAVWDLWTDVVAGSSFAQALESEASHEILSADIDFSVEQAGDVRELPRPVQAALLRIVREASNNVAKHARASSVSVKLAYMDEAVRLEVQDDGVGFDLTNRGSSELGGFGLMSMFERAKLVGGSVDVARGEAGGTLLSVTMPG